MQARALDNGGQGGFGVCVIVQVYLARRDQHQNGGERRAQYDECEAEELSHGGSGYVGVRQRVRSKIATANASNRDNYDNSTLGCDVVGSSRVVSSDPAVGLVFMDPALLSTLSG